MADYIERQAAIEEARYRQHFYEGHRDYDFAEAFELMGDRLEDLPAADVKPVVHGRWEPYAFGDYHWHKCSVCGVADEYIFPREYGIELEEVRNFCPNCGADMREVQP